MLKTQQEMVPFASAKFKRFTQLSGFMNVNTLSKLRVVYTFLTIQLSLFPNRLLIKISLHLIKEFNKEVSTPHNANFRQSGN